MGEGAFALTPEKKIFITSADDTTLLFPANLFIREVKGTLGFEPEYDLDVKKAAILMGYRGWSKRFDKLTASLTDELQQCGEEGYVLQITPERILLLANSDAGIFYGVMTLNQLVRANSEGNMVPVLTIVDRPALRWRAWQDDVSRGPIPTLSFLKEEIRTMAAMKMNAFTLYTEHVFRLKSHPDIAPADGLTAAEIRELSRFARKYHVELIGNFQAFGHFGKILSLPAYRHLAETPAVISPAFEESYRLLEDILGEIARAYDSRYFIINCDEVFGLGTGPARTMVDTMGLAGVYAYHINRLAKILRKYHKIPMMWGDIAIAHPEIIPLLPDSIIVLPWAYHAAPSFRSQIEPFVRDSLPFWVCPGVSCWGRIFPALSTAEVNISHFVRDGYQMGGQGMLNTSWDDGGENFFNFNWLPLGWGAECAWNPVTASDSVMEQRYRHLVDSWDPLFFGTEKGVAVAMLRLDSLREHPSAGNLTEHAFWQPLFGEDRSSSSSNRLLGDALAFEQESAALVRYLEQRKGTVRYHAPVMDYLTFAARRTLFLARKRTWQYRLNDPEERSRLDRDRVERELSGLVASLRSLADEYARLWHGENREWWLDTILARYRHLEEHLQQVPYHLFICPDSNFFAPTRKITIEPLFRTGRIYYTLDGSDPDTTSTLYQGPFTVDTTVLLKARMRTEKGWQKVFSKKVYVYQGPVESIRLKNPPGNRYRARGPVSLVDGFRGSGNFYDGRWLGFEEKDFVAVLKMKKTYRLDSVRITFLQQQRSWILFPTKVEVFVSGDGKNWQPFCHHNNDIPANVPGTLIRTFSCGSSPHTVRYVKVVAKNTGRLPSWHPSAGGKAWIFVDEITLEGETTVGERP